MHLTSCYRPVSVALAAAAYGVFFKWVYHIDRVIVLHWLLNAWCGPIRIKPECGPKVMWPYRYKLLKLLYVLSVILLAMSSEPPFRDDMRSGFEDTGLCYYYSRSDYNWRCSQEMNRLYTGHGRKGTLTDFWWPRFPFKLKRKIQGSLLGTVLREITLGH